MSAIASAQLALGRAIHRGQPVARALADAEPLLVGPCLAAGLVAPRLLGPALVVAGTFWFARWLAHGHLTVRAPGNRLIVFLALLTLVSLRVTAVPEVTLQQAGWLLSGVVVYFIIINWARTVERERKLVLGLIGAVLCAALLAPVTVTWVTAIKFTFIPEALYSRLPLLTSTPMHPNVLGGILALALPVPVALLLWGTRPLAQRTHRGLRPRARVSEGLFPVAAAVVIATILILTKSRGALLAGIAASLLLWQLRWRRAWVAVALAATVASVVLALIGPGPLAEKLLAAGVSVGWPGRLEIWSRGLYMVQDFPFTGIGMGTFRETANELYPFFLLGPDADVPHAHNLFLQVAVDLGIPGLLAWLGLLFFAGRNAWRVYRWGRREGDGWSVALGAGLLASHVALVVHGLLDAAVWGAHSGIVVWILWAVGAAAYNRRLSARREA